MSSSALGIIVGVITVGLAVAAFFSFSVYVLGADSTLAVTWGWKPYISAERGFTIMHPDDITIDPAYAYDGLGREKRIYGVSFSVPESAARGTNLSPVSKLSVESAPSAASCAPEAFLARPKAEKIITENGITYAFGADRIVRNGIVHEDQVYAISGSHPCVAVRYTLYSAPITVKDAAAVTEYDHAAVSEMFDAMRRSLALSAR